MMMTEETEVGIADMLRDYRDAYVRLRRAEAAVDDLKREKYKLEKQVFEAMTEEGTSSVKLASGETLMAQSQYWAGVEDGYAKEEVAQRMLDDSAFAHLVKRDFNITSLSAMVREMIANSDINDDKEEVIAQVTDRVEGMKITERNYVKVRGAKI